MTASRIIALLLALLGGWSVYSGRRVFKADGRWSRQRWQIVTVGFLLTTSSFACAAALWWGWFQPWMLLPLGASFAAMIPLPCYWEAVDRIGWLHAARNVLFALIALFCSLVGLGWLPVPPFLAER